MTSWALVDAEGQAVNAERFDTAEAAHMSANDKRGPRRFGAATGQPMLVGRTVWTAQVDAEGRVQS